MSVQLKTIEIDFDVHKAIETERQNFSETPNDVLRRLLKIADKQNRHTKLANGNPPSGKPWFGKGVTLQDGTLLRAEYNGQVYEGQIKNGRWFIEGQYFNSPSGAIGGVARTKSGKKTSLDGWIYWQVKRPEDSFWRKIDSLRQK